MRLSICIPTYQRAPYLVTLFESILQQTDYNCDLQIVVSDNASTDDTDLVVARYAERFDDMVFHRWDHNHGPDRNFLKVMEIATGEYCWLMGSDDRLEPGAIAEIERILMSHHGVAGLSVANRSYDSKMEVVLPSNNVTKLFADTTVLDGPETIFTALGEYIGFISGNVVRRDLWNAAASAEDLHSYMNGWIHAFVVGRVLQMCPHWIYVAYPCVGWRSGNDSFLSEGMYRRLEIDVAGYDRIVSGLFGKDSSVRRAMIRSSLPHARHRVLHAKVNGAPSSFFVQSRRLLTRHYANVPAFWISCYPLFFIPAFTAKVAKSIRDYARSV